jgi:hypothetical protein
VSSWLRLIRRRLHSHACAHRYTQVSWKLIKFIINRALVQKKSRIRFCYGKITGIYYGFLTVRQCLRDKLFGKACPEVLRDRIFNRASVPKKIRFFGKIGFLTVHQRPKKSDFLEKSDF